MSFKLDSEINEAFSAAGLTVPLPRSPKIGDVKSRRDAFDAFYAPLLSKNFPQDPSIDVVDYYTKSSDGHEVHLRCYSKPGSNPGSAVLFLHSGGLILGNISVFDGVVHGYVNRTGVPYLSVEYRLAPENPYPKALEDAYAGLLWLHEHAAEKGIDQKRIAVHGESAGGGLAAALAIYANEHRGPVIAKQILIYPMLDDRTIEADPYLKQFLVWSDVDNQTGWEAYIGRRRATKDVPATAAPARLSSPHGLPPIYIEIGELDLFRDETIAYASVFVKGGVSTELHVIPGAPHGFEWFAPNSAIARSAMAARARAVTTI